MLGGAILKLVLYLFIFYFKSLEKSLSIMYILGLFLIDLTIRDAFIKMHKILKSIRNNPKIYMTDNDFSSDLK